MQGQETDLWLQGLGWSEGTDCAGHSGTSWRDGDVLCDDRGGGYRTVHICQTSLNRTLKTHAFDCM